MEPLNIRNYANQPEGKIQKKLIYKLQAEGWFVKKIQGNDVQIGLPDIYACHNVYGARWIEVKQPSGYKLLDSQHNTFLELTKHGVGIWILTSDTHSEYLKLFNQANWHTFVQLWNSNRASRPIADKKEQRKQKDGPERQLQDAIKIVLRSMDWHCIDTIGSITNHGLPDLYVCHKKYGTRWLEVKNPEGFRLTPAQIQTFSAFMSHGIGVWIVQSANKDLLEKLLFSPAQWWQYLQ